MKNIYLRISDDGTLAVSSSRISKKRVYELIDEKEQWITKALQKIAIKPKSTLGEEILYFGEQHTLNEHTTFETLSKKCAKASHEQITAHYQKFYKDKATHYLQARLEYYATQMGLKPKEMRLRRMKRQWGNCRSSGIITFNIHLMQAPKECIDYVVVHELAHMVHMNHSKAFHALVDEHLPQSKEKRTHLKQFSASI